MNYFILTFLHHHNAGNLRTRLDSLGNDLADTCHQVTQVLRILASLNVKHAYTFPGDHIYKYLATPLSQEEVTKNILQALKDAKEDKLIGTHVELDSIHAESPTANPHKGVPTLAEYMSKPDGI